MKVERNWKYYLGITLFIYSFLPYCVAGILLFFRMPIAKFLKLLVIFIASAELSFAASAALLGKTVIEAIKSKIHNIFRPRVAMRPMPIGKARHRTGIALLLLSFAPYFITEASLLLGYPKTEQGHLNLFFLLLSGDTIFILSLFALGNDFWERLKKLFEWQRA